MALASPLTSYSDTTPHKRMITDVISLIDPSDTPTIEALGGLDGAGSKFRFVNGMNTKMEWLEDTLFPLADTIDGSVDSDTTAVTVDTAIFQEGDIVDIGGAGDQAWISAVDTTGLILTVTRDYNSAQASHADGVAINIVGQARLEGDVSDDRAFTDRTTGSNYTQIFHQEIKVTRTHEQLAQYGISQEFEYQSMKAVPSLTRLIELQLFNGARKAGSATTPRAMGGFGTFITDNTVNAGGTVVQADFENAALAAFSDGGVGPWIAPTAPAVLQDVKNLYDSSLLLRVGREESTIGMVVDRVVTPYGDVDLLRDRWAPVARLNMIDVGHAGLLTYYPFTMEPLAKTGDFDVGEVVGEFTLCVRQDKAHAAITGVTS